MGIMGNVVLMLRNTTVPLPMSIIRLLIFLGNSVDFKGSVHPNRSFNTSTSVLYSHVDNFDKNVHFPSADSPF